MAEHLGDPAGVPVVDEAGFPKKGAESCGVARQYTGTAGRVENARVGVFPADASPEGHARLARALYLPTPGAGRRGSGCATGRPRRSARSTTGGDQ